MEFNTIVNSERKFIAPTYTHEKPEFRFEIVDRPCLLELYLNDVEKIKKYLWQYESLDWTGVKIEKIKISFAE